VGFFIFTIIMALVGVTAVVVGLLRRRAEQRARARFESPRRGSEYVPAYGRLVIAAGGVVIVLVVIFNLVASATVVQPRTVGVQVTLGRPGHDALKNGFHWIAPWSSVDTLDTSIQTLKLTQGEKGDDKDRSRQPCATVRLANQTTACVDATTQWHVDPDGDVVDLYSRYRSNTIGVFDNIEENLIQRQLQNALNQVFEQYNPLQVIVAGTDKPSVTLTDLAREALFKLQTAVGAGIQILNITIPLVHYDKVTQEKLDAYAQALADTRIAAQRKITSQLVADANHILATDPAINNPGVMYQNCLNLVADLAAKGQLQNLPPTFNCNNLRESPVIVSAAR